MCGWYVGTICIVCVLTLHPSTKKDSVLDGVRVEDGKKVVLKRVFTSSRELQILNHLSSIRSDPRNRTIPILDAFQYSQNPEYTFFVMPYTRRFHYPPFHCRREFVEAMRQFLEVLVLPHELS
jgi:hypothetical protein